MPSPFADLGVPPKLVNALARRGITAPFPIQAATIADALAGRDLCGRAPTGSGKTLAFAIPLALRTASAARTRPRALVLTPTRELAQQVTDTVRPLAQTLDRSAHAVYGGTSVNRDVQRMKAGVDILVACPGRLADLVARGAVDLRDVDLVVIDEADRMADMGFLPEVRRLLDTTSRSRQTLLFSATLDGDVDVLVRRYQRNPIRHELAAEPEQEGDVRHLFWHVEGQERLTAARDIVRAIGPAIVFTRTKRGADRVVKRLVRDGIAAAPLHGNRSQSQRQRALRDFTDGRLTTLVATDVAARGIHVDAVGVVVHFDPPETDKDYVHRSGRTGRAGADGVVVTLVPEAKRRDVAGIQRALSLPRGLGPVAIDTLVAGDSASPPRPSSGGRSRGGQEPDRKMDTRRRTRGGDQRSRPSRRGRGHASSRERAGATGREHRHG